jgi:hypothetical protein
MITYQKVPDLMSDGAWTSTSAHGQRAAHLKTYAFFTQQTTLVIFRLREPVTPSTIDVIALLVYIG